MKTKVMLIQVLFVLVTSCTKVDGPYTTSFQFVCTNYETGDTLPNVEFSINGGYNQDNDFFAHTNAYGNFDTVFTHRSNTNFNISVSDYNKYLTVTESGDIIGGTNTSASIRVMPVTTLFYQFDCTGTGTIQNVKHNRLKPVPAIFANYQQANPSTVIQNCSNPPSFQLFSGDWVITYEYREHIGLPFTTHKDTVTLLPGEDFYYSISE